MGPTRSPGSATRWYADALFVGVGRTQGHRFFLPAAVMWAINNVLSRAVLGRRRRVRDGGGGEGR